MSQSRLITEQQNPATEDIDLLSTLEIVQKLNEEDQKVATIVAGQLPAIARTVDLIVPALRSGGRLIYLGAGTSGRLGMLDAVECLPTFGVSSDQVVALLAGGPDAMTQAIEGAEDQPELACHDLNQLKLQASDIVIGISASGHCPYVLGGLQYAKNAGCPVVSIACNDASPSTAIADIAITPVVGPELIAGSTRLKAGSAQKMILNMLSTATMIKLGKVYQNLMVDLKVTNNKLLARALRIVCAVTGLDEGEAQTLLLKTNNDVKLAIFIHLTGVDIDQGQQLLAQHHGHLRQAIKSLKTCLESP